jgi:hypothetical protein
MAQPVYVVIDTLRQFLKQLRDLAHETGGGEKEWAEITGALYNDFTPDDLPPEARRALETVVAERFWKERQDWESSDEHRRLREEEERTAA